MPKGPGSRSDSGTVYNKQTYNNLFLTFGTPGRQSAAINPSDRFLVATSQFGALTYECDTFTGLRMLYDSVGSYSDEFRCERTTKDLRTGKPVVRRAAGQITSMFTRSGNRWTLHGEATAVGRYVTEQTWRLVEDIELEVSKSGCKVIHYRFRRETPRGGTTATSDPDARCSIK